VAKLCTGTKIAFGGLDLSDRGIDFTCTNHNWRPELPDATQIAAVENLANYVFTLRFKIGTFEDALEEMNESLSVAGIEQTTDDRFPYSTNISIFDKRIEVTSYLSELHFDEIFRQTNVYLAAAGPKFYWSSVDTRVVCAKSPLSLDTQMAHLFFEEELSGLVKNRPKLNYVFGSDSFEDLRQ
jgi:hypothetical protein